MYAAAGALGGIPAIAGVTAVQEDWRDPKRAAIRTGLGSTIPLGAARLAARAAQPVINRLSSPAAQAGTRIGAEVVGGAAGNVGQSAAEQQYFEGRIDPQELYRQAIIGGAVSGAAAAPFAGRSAATAQPEAQPIAQAPEIQPATQPAATRPALPAGVQIIRQRTTEAMLRPYAEQAVRPAPQPVTPAPQPQPQPVQPVPSGPISAPAPEPTPVPTPAQPAEALRSRAGADVEVFRAGEQPEYNPATQKAITFKGPDRQDYIAIAPKGMARADAATFGRARIPAQTQRLQTQAIPGQPAEPPPLLRPQAIVNPEGGIPPAAEPPVSFKAPSRAPIDEGSDVTLEQFVISQGGLKRSRYDRGEASYLLGREGGRPGVVSDRGLFADQVRERANEAGYGPFETVDDFMQGLINEGRTMRPSSYTPDVEGMRREGLEAEDTVAFQRLLDDPPLARAYGQITSGRRYL